MADLLDYVLWRGDVEFSYSPFNEIDALIFSELSYLDFKGLVDSDFEKKIALSELAKKFQTAGDFSSRIKLGPLINAKAVDLLFAVGKAKRFSEVFVTGYRSHLDYEKEEQFAALVFLFAKKNALVVFRGTDDTILGWKEDFNMAFLDSLPSQNDGLAYAKKAMEIFRWKQFYFAGHSKGGNIAIFAAASIEKKFEKRIKTIYNFDGPGFPENIFLRNEFQNAFAKTKSFYPKLSIVGMLFERGKNYKIVECEKAGLMEHDPFMWNVVGNTFLFADEFDKASILFHETFNEWFRNASVDEKRESVETLFRVLGSADVKTNSELSKRWFTSTVKMIYSLATLDKKSRDMLTKTLQIFVSNWLEAKQKMSK